MPDVEPFTSLLPDVQLGVRAADLQESRPNFEISGDGTYGESCQRHEVVYHFWPNEPDRPPPLAARLMAVEARENLFDSLRLWSEWRRAVVVLEGKRGVEAVCQVLGDSRATITRALFVDSIRVSVAAEIWRAPDGQKYQAFLVTRAGLEPIESAEESALNRRDVPCDDVEGGAL